MTSESPDTVPLCVDLDGTLLKTDMFQESFCALARHKPWLLPLFLVWLARGRAYAKRKILEHVAVDTEHLPYHNDVVEYLREKKTQGRTIVLATASDRQLAESIAHRVGVFDEVVASEGKVNYSGHAKARELERRFPHGFDYAGNAPVDFKVWDRSREVIVVSHDPAFVERVLKRYPDATVFHERRQGLGSVVRALRVHQWVKNLLVFVPLLMAHRWGEVSQLFHVLGAFVAFSLCASSVYLLNDLLDLESDRVHHRKRERPFARGDLSLAVGMLLVPLLLAAALLYALSVSISFLLVLLGYFLLTTAYSLRLKRIAIIDILVLASLYALRVFAGGVAGDVAVSPWLLGFSIFLFFSLAALKRVSELMVARERQLSDVRGRGYRPADLEQVMQFGSTSGYLAVLVLALYVNSQDVVRLYAHPDAIWLICPLLLYWISRVWLLAHRGELHDDPIVFAITDRVSYVTGALAGVVLYLAA